MGKPGEKSAEEVEKLKRLDYTVKIFSKKFLQILQDPDINLKYLRQLITARVGDRTKNLVEGRRMANKGYDFIVTHFHSSYSSDGQYVHDPFKEVVKVMRRYRVKVLFVTDHDNNEFFRKISCNPPPGIKRRYDIWSDSFMIRLTPRKGRKREAKSVYIINAQENHVLTDNVYGLNKELITVPGITPYRTLDDTVKESHDQGGLQIISHPGLADSVGIGNLDGILEMGEKIGANMAVEGFNGGITFIQSYANIEAENYLLANPSVPRTAGSDAHRLHDMPNCGVWMPREHIDYSTGLNFLASFYSAISSPEEYGVVLKTDYAGFSETFKLLAADFISRMRRG